MRLIVPILIITFLHSCEQNKRIPVIGGGYGIGESVNDRREG